MQEETLARTTSGYPMLVVLPITILTGVAGAALLGAIAAKIFAVIVAVLACGATYTIGSVLGVSVS